MVVDVCFSCPQLHFLSMFQGNWPRRMSTTASRSIHLGFLRQQQLPTAFLCIFLRKWRRQMSTSNLSLSVSDRLRWWLTFVSRVRSCIFGAFFKEIGRGKCQPAAFAAKTKPKPQYSNTVLEVFVASRAARSIHLGFLHHQQRPTAVLCIFLRK